MTLLLTLIGKIYVQHAENYNKESIVGSADNISESGFGKVVVEVDLGTNPAGDIMINFHYTADAEL